jgi:hypothetical protein|tara:strand:- start:1810 stop:1965 length:156 start_codon:yes stop_codon:yes gene_type:complete
MVRDRRDRAIYAWNKYGIRITGRYNQSQVDRLKSKGIKLYRISKFEPFDKR